MRFITTSDWHIGNMFHGNDRLNEHEHFLQWLTEQIKCHRPDAMLVAGDIFDTANPSASAQSVYYGFIADVTKECPNLRIIITAGNHDSPSRLEAPRALLTRQNVEVRGSVKRAWKNDGDNGHWDIDFDDLTIPLEGDNGDRVVVLAVPFLRNDVVQGSSYSDGVTRFIGELTRHAREKYPLTPLVMMAHMYAKGAEIAGKDRSEKIEIGSLDEVSLEGWTDHPDYFTSGHIHKRQHIWNTDWARYTGSILPMSFAETDYHHGVDLVDIEAGSKPKVTFLEYTPQHKLRILPHAEEELSIKNLEKLIAKELPDRKGDVPDDDFEYLLLKVKLDKVSNDDIKILEAAVEKKNAVLCKIQKILPMLDLSTITDSQSLQSIDDILDRDPLETLKETFLIKHNAPMSAHQEEMLKSLLENINSDI